MYTEIHRGSFTSTGASQYIPLVTDVDWMNVYNWSTINAGPAATTATQAYWQRGMADNDGLMTMYNGAGTFLINATSTGLVQPGFLLYNSSDDPLMTPVAVTQVTNANPPVVTTGSTAGLVAGDIVRLQAIVGGNQISSMDFTIDTINANVSFRLPYMRQIVLAAAGGVSMYRKLKYDAVWYPRKRFITKIAALPADATKTVITMSVTHSFVVGQTIRLHVPAVRGSTAFGMEGLDNLTTTITAINQADADGVVNTITIDVNCAAFTAFSYPLTAFDRFTFPTVTPVGEDSNLMANTTADDAPVNTGARGIILGAGAQSPAGVNGNIIYWTAGKSNL
jgi:hypothetical protein